MVKNITKKVAQQVAQIVQDTGEALVKEPAEFGKTAARQAMGVELPTAQKEKMPEGVSRQADAGEAIRQHQAEQQRQKELDFYRRQLDVFKQDSARLAQQQRRQGISQEQEAAGIKQAEIVHRSGAQVEAPGGKTKRGTALIGGRMKKSKQAGFEMGGQAAKRSR